jgi:hypothetical protein
MHTMITGCGFNGTSINRHSQTHLDHLLVHAGSGKTLGFLLPALHRIAIGELPRKAAGPSVLVRLPPLVSARDANSASVEQKQTHICLDDSI